MLTKLNIIFIQKHQLKNHDRPSFHPNLSNMSLFAAPGPWFYLNPDYRRDRPDHPHCCRCGKSFRRETNMIVVEVDWENVQVRNNPMGKELIGHDCWAQVQKEPM
jgi:hypothetical protein